MIDLNLLPKELRNRKKEKQLPDIPLFPIFLGVISILVITHLLLLALLKTSNDLCASLDKRWVQMQPQRQKTEDVTKELNDLKKRIDAVRGIAGAELDWTQLLDGLNQAVIPSIWLSDLNLRFRVSEEKKEKRTAKSVPDVLFITGYGLGKSEQATSEVAKFINSLKKTGSFSVYFKEIELDNMNSLEIAGEEVMMFNLSCKFKYPEAPLEKDKIDAKK